MSLGFLWPQIEVLSGANNLYANLEVHPKKPEIYSEINWPDGERRRKEIIAGKCLSHSSLTQVWAVSWRDEGGGGLGFLSSHIPTVEAAVNLL